MAKDTGKKPSQKYKEISLDEAVKEKYLSVPEVVSATGYTKQYVHYLLTSKKFTGRTFKGMVLVAKAEVEELLNKDADPKVKASL